MAKKKDQAPVNEERMQKHKINLTPAQHEVLRRLAFDDRTTISFQIRRAVDRYLRWRQTGRHKQKESKA